MSIHNGDFHNQQPRPVLSIVKSAATAAAWALIVMIGVSVVVWLSIRLGWLLW